MLCADCVFWPWLFDPLVRTLGVLLSGPPEATSPTAVTGEDAKSDFAASVAGEADKEKYPTNSVDGVSESTIDDGCNVCRGDGSGGDAITGNVGEFTAKTKRIRDMGAEGCDKLSGVAATRRQRQVWISGAIYHSG